MCGKSIQCFFCELLLDPLPSVQYVMNGGPLTLHSTRMQMGDWARETGTIRSRSSQSLNADCLTSSNNNVSVLLWYTHSGDAHGPLPDLLTQASE